MDVLPRTQFLVEPPREGTAVIRVAGELTGEMGPRLLRLLDESVRRPAGRTVRVIVDLANVRSFEVEAVALLHSARLQLDEAGVLLVLAGLDAHRRALPDRIDHALEGLDTVSELEDVLGPGVPPDRARSVTGSRHRDEQEYRRRLDALREGPRPLVEP